MKVRRSGGGWSDGEGAKHCGKVEGGRWKVSPRDGHAKYAGKAHTTNSLPPTYTVLVLGRVLSASPAEAGPTFSRGATTTARDLNRATVESKVPSPKVAWWGCRGACMGIIRECNVLQQFLPRYDHSTLSLSPANQLNGEEAFGCYTCYA